MIMKKLSRLLTLAMIVALPLLAFVSCGGDDNEPVFPDLPNQDETEQNGGSSNEGEIVGEIADIQEPILEFGKSKDYVKSKETNKLKTEAEEILMYTDDKHSQEIIYQFNPGLKFVTLQVYNASYESVLNFYRKNYSIKSELTDVAIFIDWDKSIYVQVYNHPLKYTMVTYAEAPEI